jgi:hypothetical protein
MSDSTLPPAAPPSSARTRKYGGPNGYGHVKSARPPRARFHVLKRRLGLAMTISAALATLPLSASMKSWVDKSKGGPGIGNQLETSACTGFATAGACTTQLAKLHAEQGLAPPDPLSPEGNYTYSRCIDRAPNADGTLPPLTDDGASPESNMRAITEWGCPTIAQWGKHPPDPKTINDEPDPRCLEEGAEQELDGEYGIESTGDQRVVDVMQALDAGFCVTFAIDVDGAVEDWSGGAALGAPDPYGILGGHDLYCVGYTCKAKADGTPDLATVEFEFANSWDVTWGEAGFGRGNRAFFDGWTDLYVMKVSPKASAQAGKAAA